MTLSLKNDCRVEYVNRYSLLIDYSDGEKVIIYYEYGIHTLKELYGNYKFRKDNEMEIDLFAFPFFPYPVKTH